MSYHRYDINLIQQLHKPLEEYSKEDQLSIAKQKMRAMIDESDFNYDAPKNSRLAKSIKQRNSFCRKVYQNTSESSDYDYLYRNIEKQIKGKDGLMKTITLKQPARVRHIPIVSPKIRALVSREDMRPLKIRSYAIDKHSIERKNNVKVKSIANKYSERVYARMAAIQAQAHLVQARKDLLNEYAEMPELKDIVNQIQDEINHLQDVINRELNLSNKEYETINKYFKYSYQDFQEIIAQKLVQSYVQKNRIKRLFNKAFEEKMITDNPIYYVDYIPGDKEPVFELVRPEYFDHQYSESTDDLEKVGWCVRLRNMTFEEIIVTYKDLTKEQIDRIKAEMPIQSNRSTSNLDRTPDGYYVGVDDKVHTNASHQLYSVYECYWKEYVAVPALISPNKHKSNYLNSKPDFVRFLTTEQAKAMTSSDGKRKKILRDGKKIDVRYRVDMWEGVLIGDETWTNIGKRKHQFRDSSKPWDVEMPFVGKNIHRFNQPRSLVWECRDIQELYNILHYQEELLINLSGVKGVVYDLAQKPEGMSPQEVAYYMKQGIMYIKTVKANGKKVNSSFNQFQSFDQTLAPAVQYISAMKQSLINMVSMITGIYQNLEGQVANTDQVGTMQMSIQQSSASVETYYQEQEDLNERALTKLANLFEYAKKFGYSGSYVLNKVEQEVFQIPAGALDGFFKVMINSGLKEKEALDQIRQIATNKLQKGEIKGSEYLALVDMDSIVEMRKFFEESEEKFMQIAQQSESNASQAQQQLIQLKAQMDMQSKQLEGQIKERLKSMELALKEKELQLQGEIAKEEIEIKKEQVLVNREKIESEREIEEKYLEFSKEELAINATNQKTQLLLQNIQNKVDLYNKSRSKEKIKD